MGGASCSSWPRSPAPVAINAIFAIQRKINGRPAERWLVVRQEQVAPLVTELEYWMRAERGRLSRHNDIACAMDYMLKRWPAARLDQLLPWNWRQPDQASAAAA